LALSISSKSCYAEAIMIDPELKNHLEKIENELSHIRKSSAGTWQALGRGVVYGAGYVIGAVFIIVIIGWVLNVIGVIPAFDRQVTAFRTALENIR
jgi:hypothetical protein